MTLKGVVAIILRITDFGIALGPITSKWLKLDP